MSILDHVRKRAGSSVVSIAVELIIFAAIGLVALVLLATSATTQLNSTVGFLAVTFVSMMAVIAVAIGFVRKTGAGINI